MPTAEDVTDVNMFKSIRDDTINKETWGLLQYARIFPLAILLFSYITTILKTDVCDHALVGFIVFLIYVLIKLCFQHFEWAVNHSFTVYTITIRLLGILFLTAFWIYGLIENILVTSSTCNESLLFLSLQVIIAIPVLCIIWIMLLVYEFKLSKKLGKVDEKSTNKEEQIYSFKEYRRQFINTFMKRNGTGSCRVIFETIIKIALVIASVILYSVLIGLGSSESKKQPEIYAFSISLCAELFSNSFFLTNPTHQSSSNFVSRWLDSIKWLFSTIILVVDIVFISIGRSNGGFDISTPYGSTVLATLIITAALWAKITYDMVKSMCNGNSHRGSYSKVKTDIHDDDEQKYLHTTTVDHPDSPSHSSIEDLVNNN